MFFKFGTNVLLYNSLDKFVDQNNKITFTTIMGTVALQKFGCLSLKE